MTDTVLYTTDDTGKRFKITTSNPLPVSSIGTGSANTTNITTSTTSGTTTSGALSYSIQNIGGADGTIDSVTFAVDEVFSEDGHGAPLNSISFNATGTTFRIAERTV